MYYPISAGTYYVPFQIPSYDIMYHPRAVLVYSGPKFGTVESGLMSPLSSFQPRSQILG